MVPKGFHWHPNWKVLVGISYHFFGGEEVTGILLFFLGGWNFVIKKGSLRFFGGVGLCNNP